MDGDRFVALKKSIALLFVISIVGTGIYFWLNQPSVIERAKITTIDTKTKIVKEPILEKKDFINCSDSLLNLPILTKPKDYKQTDEAYWLFQNNNSIPANGCLVVNWQKWTKNNWWKGILNWQWVLKIENEAFVFNGEARNSSTSNHQLDLLIKLFALSNESNQWKVKWYRANELKGITKKYHDEMFPKGFDNNSWGFDPDYDKSCKWSSIEDNCNFDLKTTSEKFEKHWDWEETSTGKDLKKFSDLHSNYFDFLGNFPLRIGFNDRTQRLGIWKEI